jgi:hypothetical protein
VHHTGSITLDRNDIFAAIKQRRKTMSDNQARQVDIVDIRMPFWSMVMFLVKVSIAAIPAFIILSIIGTLFFTALNSLVIGLGNT